MITSNSGSEQTDDTVIPPTKNPTADAALILRGCEGTLAFSTHAIVRKGQRGKISHDQNAAGKYSASAPIVPAVGVPTVLIIRVVPARKNWWLEPMQALLPEIECRPWSDPGNPDDIGIAVV